MDGAKPQRKRKPKAAKVAPATPAEAPQESSHSADPGLGVRSTFFASPVEAMRRYYAAFPDFLRDIWKHAIPGAPEPTRIQYDTADFLQHGPPKRIILGFRGYGKSYIFGAYWMWRLLQNPEERLKYLSGDDDKVSQFSNWCKGLRYLPAFPVLYHLRPNKGQKDDQYMWDVGPASLQQYPSFSGSTATSAIQGGRCTIGGLDDPEQKSNADSELKRARILKHAMDVSNMLIPESSRDLIVLGNYQSLSSIYITMIRDRGFEPFFVPSEVPRDIRKYHGKLAPTIAEMAKEERLVGTSTEPLRFSAKDLREQRRTIGDLQYQLEWMVDDSSGDRFEHPFPLDRLIVFDVNSHGAPAKIVAGVGEKERIQDIPVVGLAGDALYRPSHVEFIGQNSMLPYQHVLMAIDPSGSGDRDECAWVILGAVPGQIHLIAWGGRKNGVDPVSMKQIAKAAENAGVREIVYESNMQAWGSLFEQVLQEQGKANGYFCKVEGVRSNQAKELRIVSTLEPILYGSQLIVSRRGLQEEYDQGMKSGDPRWRERLLQYQMALFRRNIKAGGLAFDDRLDALTIGLAYLHERFLRTGTANAAAAEAERLLLEEDAEWQEQMFGGRREEPLWVNDSRR